MSSDERRMHTELMSSDYGQLDQIGLRFVGHSKLSADYRQLCDRIRDRCVVSSNGFANLPTFSAVDEPDRPASEFQANSNRNALTTL